MGPLIRMRPGPMEAGGMWILPVLVLLVVLSSCAPYRKSSPADPQTARQIFEIRQSTERFLDLDQAVDEGYFRGSGYISRQGYQFYNARYLRTVDLRNPPILLYDEYQGRWQLYGVMYAVPQHEDPLRTLPFLGAQYLAHGSMCHYLDGKVLPAESPEICPDRHPLTDAELGFWHPKLWLVAVWAWSPNPDGSFALFNPLLGPR